VTKAKLAEVIAFPPRCGDIAAMLRLMADEIEAGEHGDVVHIVSVVSGNRVDVRAWGSCDGLTSIATLNLGLAALVNNTLDAMAE
jgi:hypothetical protein